MKGISSPPAVLKVKVVNFIRDMTGAGGNQAITGVGFKPKTLIFHSGTYGISGQFSVGMTDGVSDRTTFDDYMAVANYWNEDNRVCYFDQGSGNNFKANWVSFDTDGFTILWDKAGGPTGYARCSVLCIG